MSNKYNDFQDMPVWQKAMDLSVKIFKLTANLPICEDYGLKSQMRRSSVSVCDNIAEGFGREYTKDKMRFYFNSRGSIFELKNQLIYGYKVKYFDCEEQKCRAEDCENILMELNKLIKTLKNKSFQSQPQPQP